MLETASSGCGCSTTENGLKKPASWQGHVALTPLPASFTSVMDDPGILAEVEYAQGDYNPANPETPLSIPLISGGANASSFGHSHKAELLSPAGGPDAGYAAFHYGADAIYLGMQKFSARAEAENFTLDDIDAITAYAHALPQKRRVFVTINTVILQKELREAVESLAALAEIGVDALIIQDLGTYKIVRKHFPELELHASTQLAVHNRAGAETLREMGFKRVVLARELTLEEVRDITSTSGVETEVFIHGALCYSYSGLCLFSSQTNGRSGNRGKCAYSCRDNFDITSAPESLRDGTPVKRDPSAGFAFSMKDLALPDHIPALREAGVSCFKIEGRKKSPLYVATTTDYYRKLVDGTLQANERAGLEENLKTVFSRPWTRLFTQSHKDKEVADRDTVGHRGAPVGVVETVFEPGTENARLRFKTSRKLERHDGLQVDVPGLGDPFGFAVETMRVQAFGAMPNAATEAQGAPRNRLKQDRFWREVFVAPAGSLVEVSIPEEHPEIPAGAIVYCSSSQEVKQRYLFSRPKPGLYVSRRDVDVALTLDRNGLTARAVVTQRTGQRELRAEVSETMALLPAKDTAKMETAARGAFEKMGETRLRLAQFTLENPEKLFAPVSVLNELRRKLAEKLERILEQAAGERINAVCADVLPAAEHMRGRTRDFTKDSSVPTDFRWLVKTDRIEHLAAFEAADWERVDEVIVDIARDHMTTLLRELNSLREKLGENKVRVALPPLTRKWEENGLLLKIRKLLDSGFKLWEASNVSAWAYLGVHPSIRDTGDLNLAADWALYTVNRMAASQLFDMGASYVTLSPEDGLDNIRSLLAELGSRAVVPVHQDTPMFMAESCAYANLIGGCPGKANCKFESMEMVNRHGEKVLALDYHCRTIVLNQGAYCLAPRLKDLAAAGAVRLRADFIFRKYAPEESRNAWRLVRSGKNVPRGHAANFDRGMQ